MKKGETQAGLTAPPHPGPSWSADWPQIPGWYWFYGHTHGILTPTPELVPVKVSKRADGKLFYVARDFMYQNADHHSARGWWVRILVPSIANQE